MSNAEQQYAAIYGTYHPGEFPIGSQIPGEGEVLWSFLRDDKLIYVCSSNGSFPNEVAAAEVKA